MATMNMTLGNSATCTVQALRPARSAPRAGIGMQVPGGHLMQAADVTMRFALALMPFSTLVWMFVAH